MTNRKSRIGLVIAGMMLALVIAVLDQTVVSTIVPTVVGELGGMDRFSWLFSTYMIAVVVATPIAGKMSDRYGKKPLMLSGILVFLLGSALCGTAQTMQQLIMYRILQGIGGGMIVPVVFGLITVLFPEEKRGKMNGLFGAVLGLASVFGPMAGAFFTDHMSWRWAFYINLPLGLLALLLFATGYRETKGATRGSIDWLGALTLAAGVVCFMLALEYGNRDNDWLTFRVVWLLAAAIILKLLFIWIETKASDPILPMFLFKSRVFSITMIVGVAVGVVLMACSTYIPFFVQGVEGRSATTAGQTLTPMMLSLVFGSIVGGLLVNRLTYRTLLAPAIVVMGISVYLLSRLEPSSGHGAVFWGMIIAGAGMGAVVAVLNLSAVSRLQEEHHGTAVALVSFFRNVGSAVGVALLGAVQTSSFRNAVAEQLPDTGGHPLDPRMMLDAAVRTKLSHELLEPLRFALSQSLDHIFLLTLCLAVFALLIVPFMGRARVAAGQKPRGLGH